MARAIVESVGGLLPRDLLARVTAGDGTLAGTDPTDYGLVLGERITDAITRSWHRLQAVWEAFRRAEAELPDTEYAATGLTRDRWLRPLLDELGFAGLPVIHGVSIDGKEYALSHRWGATVPIHLVGWRVTIDRVTRGVAGAARMSPHGLVQELLNRSPDSLWGIVSNGRVLRLLRDNVTLTRQAYLQFDVEAMFVSESFADFATLWLTCHRTRFEGEPAEKCFLEQWSTEAATAGTRALDRLRDGVEAAITLLGQGFVAHRDNSSLRHALRQRTLTADSIQRQLLRFVYRLLFLLVAESRDLLLDPAADEIARRRYIEYYSLERLRRLAGRRRGTAHDDLWRGLRVTISALAADGAPAIGLAPLGSSLWSAQSTPDLDAALIDNHHLLAAVRHLCFTRDRDGGQLRSVDYANLGAEELGSIYEALLELHADVDPDARTFRLDTAAGNERKTTGSYYTPTPLIRVLLDSALDPVIAEAAAQPDAEAALLGLKVLDPAAGSGHFLIAAAHRIANRLAQVRAGDESEPAPADVRHAVRDVIAHCIYAIDVNPMAVELCKVSLWMEATEPGLPLSFLDHHIRLGNALLGTTPALIDAGVPDAAYKPLTGDDKAWVSALKKANKTERTRRVTGQGAFAFGSLAEDVATLAAELSKLDAIAEADSAAVAEKERRYRELESSDAATRARLAADAWCTAFVVSKRKDELAITDAVVQTCGRNPASVPADKTAAIAECTEQYRFLHPHVAFPDVFTVPDDPADATNPTCGWSGGFDVVLGNPPWDKVEFKEQEFFAVRSPEIASLAGARRKKAIAELPTTDPATHDGYVAALRENEGTRRLLSDSGRFPLCGRGKVNTYSVFAELMRNAISPTGRLGVIVPTGIATDDTTKFFFDDLVETQQLVSLFDFENRRPIFPGVHRSYKFALLTLTGMSRPAGEAEFVFFALDVTDLDDPEKRFTLAPEDFALLNPNTKTCPVFRTRRDAEITKAIYRRVPVLVRESDPDGNPWGVSFKQGLFNMTSDSGMFRTRDELEADGWTLEGNHFVRGADRYLPLYEAKMIHHFDHRWATYEGTDIRDVTLEEKQDPTFVVMPRYWVPGKEVEGRSNGVTYVAGWREVCRSTDERTWITAVAPAVGYGHKFQLAITPATRHMAAAGSSLVADYVARQKVGGTAMSYFIAKQLPLPPAARMPSWQLPVVLELSYTAWDLAPFAADLGYHGPPFRWDPERRALLRAELDALMFRLYGVERDDVDYILDTFPIVRRNDERQFSEYRTKRLILERFDAMAVADAAGRPYESVLDPPPADRSLAHRESTRPGWAVIR